MSVKSHLFIYLIPISHWQGRRPPLVLRSTWCLSAGFPSTSTVWIFHDLKSWGGDRNLHCRSAGKLQTVFVWGNLNHTEADNKMLLWAVFTLFNQKRIMSNWQKTKGAALRALACVCATSLSVSIWNSVDGDVTATMATFFFCCCFLICEKTWKKRF